MPYAAGSGKADTDDASAWPARLDSRAGLIPRQERAIRRQREAAAERRVGDRLDGGQSTTRNYHRRPRHQPAAGRAPEVRDLPGDGPHRPGCPLGRADVHAADPRSPGASSPPATTTASTRSPSPSGTVRPRAEASRKGGWLDQTWDEIAQPGAALPPQRSPMWEEIVWGDPRRVEHPRREAKRCELLPIARLAPRHPSSIREINADGRTVVSIEQERRTSGDATPGRSPARSSSSTSPTRKRQAGRARRCCGRCGGLEAEKAADGRGRDRLGPVRRRDPEGPLPDGRRRSWKRRRSRSARTCASTSAPGSCSKGRRSRAGISTCSPVRTPCLTRSRCSATSTSRSRPQGFRDSPGSASPRPARGRSARCWPTPTTSPSSRSPSTSPSNGRKAAVPPLRRCQLRHRYRKLPKLTVSKITRRSPEQVIAAIADLAGIGFNLKYEELVEYLLEQLDLPDLPDDHDIIQEGEGLGTPPGGDDDNIPPTGEEPESEFA